MKAAIQIERSFNALNFGALKDGELDALRNYWREISDWCGKVRIEMPKLDPEQEWTVNAWTGLFNVFGRVNLLVQIAWSERSREHSQRKANQL